MKMVFLISLMIMSSSIKRQVTTNYINYTLERRNLSKSEVEYEINFKNGIKLHGKTESFDTLKHKMTYFENRLKLIDDQKFYGSDFEIPLNRLVYLIFEYKGEKLKLDVSKMYNVWFWEPSQNQNMNLHLEQIKNGWQLIAIFSDAAGVYVVKWILLKTKQFRPIISNEESDIVNLFYNGEF